MAPLTRPATLRLNADVVRNRMRSLGITSQERLADEISVGRATVVRAMSGRTAPGDALLAGLALRLGVSLNELAVVVDPEARTA